jgi:Tfp pilus assembly protein PilN/Tfp pilus assembly PilM family ATPase
MPWPLSFTRSYEGSAGALVVGADIGIRRIKLVGVGDEGSRVALLWSMDVPTPGGIFGPEGQFDSVAAGRVLAQLLGGAPVAGAVPGAVVLPSAALRVRRLQAAASDPAALTRVLADDSELRVPGVPVEGLYHAVCALGGTLAGARADAGGALLAAAARRDAIRAYVAAGSAADLRPLRLASPAAALANLHAAIHPDEVDGPVLLLHVGSLRSELVVVHGGAPLLALPVVQGTGHLFDRLRAGAGGDARDPETLLQNPDGAVQTALDEWVGRLRGAHRTAVGAAERHLRRTLDELPVRVSGGIARFEGVVERLAAAIPAPVAVLDPGTRFPPGGEAFAPALVLALGAALEARAALRPEEESAGGALPVTLDLAVPEARSPGAAGREAVLAVTRDAAVWAAALVALFLAAGAPALLQGRLRTLEAELGRGQQAYAREAEQVAADSARVSALQADSARLAGTLGTLASLEADRYGWPRLMHAAANALPSYAWLESLELQPGAAGESSRFRISAVAPAQADVSRYERALGGFAGAGRVALEGSESLQAGPFALVGFRLAGTYGEARAGVDQPRPGGAGYHEGAPTAVPSPAAP